VFIRRLNEVDGAEFRALRLRALRESPEAFGSSYEETAAQPAEYLTRWLRTDPDAPHDFFLGAFDPSMIGMVGFARESRLKTRHKGSIRSMYVAPEARGKGVGRSLLEQAIAEARRQPDLEQIALLVVSTNPGARRLYASCGFTVYGIEPHALKVGGRYFDEDLMILHLAFCAAQGDAPEKPRPQQVAS
jgi:RimJ/RimL family protein N-acetyltransferase